MWWSGYSSDRLCVEKIISLNQFFSSYCVTVQLGWPAQMCTWNAGWQLSDQPNVLPSCQAKSRTAILLCTWSWWTVVSAYVVGQDTCSEGIYRKLHQQGKKISSGMVTTISHRQQGKWQPQSTPQNRTII